MSLALDLKKLGSTLIRKQASGEEMLRSIAGPLNSEKEEGGILDIFGKIASKINDFGAKVSGSLLKRLGNWGWQAVSWLMYQVPSIVRGVWNFNWNATDEEMDAQWANFVNNFAGLVGGTFGSIFGWTACGIVPGLIAFKFSKILALRILKEVGEEMLEELAANVWNLTRVTVRSLAVAGAVNLYKATRRAIKRLVGGDSDFAYKFQKLVGPKMVENIKKWGEKGSKPWSFGIAQEEYTDEGEGPSQNFKEEFVEEAQDACEEAWYIVASVTDDWIHQQRLERQSFLGENEVVELYPDRENEEERIILAGPQELLKPVIVNTITQYQMIEERNIGNFMGETIETVANREVRTLMARLIFSSSEKGKKDVTSVTLYNVDKSKLDWLELKEAMGGVNGYMWGACQVNAILDDETIIRIWAASEEEGVDRVQALSKFVEGEISVINSYHELKEGKRKIYDSLYKKARKQYPWELLIINPVQILNEENGKANKKGIYKDREALIPLWPKDKPDDWAQKLADLFATPGPDDL